MRNSYCSKFVKISFALLVAVHPGCTDCNSPDSIVSLDVDASESDSDDSDPRDSDTKRETAPPDSKDTEVRDGDDGNDDSGPHYDDAQYAGCPLSQEMAETPYVCQDSNAHMVEYSDYQSNYKRPDHPPANMPTTVQEIKEDFGDELPRNANAVGFSDELEPLPRQEAGYAEVGDDVTLHIATIHPRSDYRDSKIKFTAMLNYRPTEATYEHYSDDRKTVLSQKVGTSAAFPVDASIELVDITIPAEAFDRPGRYDLAFGWENYGIDRFSDSWESVSIYYGGCTPPSHECASGGKLQKQTAQEQKVHDKYVATGYLVPAGKHEGHDPFERVQLDGGQEVTVQIGMHPVTDSKSSWMLVPTVNGDPVDKRQHIFTAAGEGEPFYVAARTKFTVRIPDEPGTHNVEIATFALPYFSWAESSEHELGHSPLAGGTNTLKYVVNEDEE